MSKKFLLGLTVILLVMVSSQTFLNQDISLVQAASTPSKLKIYVGPAKILADNSVYECVAVQLQDSKGNPTRAQQDLTISLSSSLTNIGIIDPTIVVSSGATYATARFKTTFTPGTTTLTATASGYATVQATVTTVGPVPSGIMVYGFPSTLPADSQTYEGVVIVQLQDSSGNPAMAPTEGLTITLSSSNSEIGKVDPTVTIEKGQTYAATQFTTTMKPGTVSITAIAEGYTSKQATFTTQATATSPSSLKIYLGPPKVPADWASYKQIAVVLQGASGTIARANKDITVTLASSEPEVGRVDQTITVPEGQPYVIAYFDATYKPGTTTITATATDLKTTQATITTVGSLPTKLAVYAVPPTMPSDSQDYSILQVQLQDSSGKPARDPYGDVVVNLFSSTPDGGDVTTQQLTIPFGQTTIQGTFRSTYSANSTSITAQASDYATGQVKITTYLIDQFSLSVQLVSNSTAIIPGKNTTITAYVTYEGKQPALGAKIAFTSTKGGNFTAPKYEGNGTYTTVFIAPKSSVVCNVTANVTKTGYISSVGSKQITVSTSANFDPSSIGTLLIHANENGNTNPVSDAYIMTTSVPSGASPLNGITNGSGYVVFSSVLAGSYALQVTKDGFDNQTQFVTVKAGQTATCNVLLSQTPSSLPLIIAIIGIVAVAAGLGGFMFLRRRRSKRFENTPTSPLDYSSMQQ